MSAKFPGVDIDAVHGGKMTEKPTDEKLLAYKLDGLPPNWLPGEGPVVNATFSLQERDMIVKALRSDRYVQCEPSELEKFAIAVLEESREDMGDVDGGWIQDRAQGYGLLQLVPVTEPCGELCNCAEYGEFPQDCLRYTDAVEAKRKFISHGG